jgi:hypothetical protein
MLCCGIVALLAAAALGAWRWRPARDDATRLNEAKDGEPR